MGLPDNKPAKELGFKEGDRFRYVGEMDSDCRPGDILRLTKDDDSRCPYFRNESTGEEVCVYFSELETLEKSLETLDQGDIVEGNWGKIKVLAVLAPGVYLMSITNAFDDAGSCYTAKELEEEGYHLQVAEPTLPREITMAEVEAKFGEPVRIKKEDK